MKKFILPILVMGLMLVAMPSMAAEWYVDSETGNDANTGAEASPFQTIGAALSQMSGGDTAYLNGEFTESVSIGSGLSGSQELGMTVLTTWPGNPQAVIDASGYGEAIDLTNVDYFHIGNLAITGASTRGVKVNSGSSYIDINACTIYNVDLGSGVYSEADYTRVINNVIYSMKYGVSFQGNSYSMIANNTFYDITDGVLNFESLGGTIAITNNIMHSIRYAIKPDTSSLSFVSSDYNSFYTYNGIVYVPTSDTLISLEDWQGTYGQDVNSLKDDPKLADVANGDFHLTDDSICVDAGTTVDDVTQDYEQDTRPIGDAYDIGADEHYYLVAPENLSSDRAIYKADLDWDDVTNAESYEIKYGKGQLLNGNKVVDKTSTNSAKTITSLNNAGRYYWKVRALGTNGQGESVKSDWSETKRLVTYPRKLKKAEIKVIEKEAKRARIRVDSMASRVTGFNIILAKKTSKTYKKVKTVKVSNKSNKTYTRKWLTGLKADTKYRIRIKARRKIGNNKYLSQNTVSKYFTTLSE